MMGGKKGITIIRVAMLVIVVALLVAGGLLIENTMHQTSLKGRITEYNTK